MFRLPLVVQNFLIFGMLILLLVFDLWAFQTFDQYYFQWYLNNGSFIALVTAMFAIAWGELDKLVGLISPHPRAYVAACMRLVGVSVQVCSGELAAFYNQLADRSSKLQTGSAQLSTEYIWHVFDGIAGVFLALAFISLLTLWLIIVAPIQYFVFFLCGSLPRIMHVGPVRYIAKIDPEGVTVDKIRPKEEIPNGWWDASFGTRPVAFTSLLSSLFLLLLDSILQIPPMPEIPFWPH